MKDWHIITLIILGIIFAIALFSGAFTTLPKLFRPSSKQIERIDSSAAQKKQQQRMQELEEQRRQMTEQQKQKIRDFQHR